MDLAYCAREQVKLRRANKNKKEALNEGKLDEVGREAR
jgi:hypothetical protein